MIHHLRRATIALLFFAPGLALAHPGHEASTFLEGLAHPIGGLDHLLAMIAVGILASRFTGSARLALPAAFLVAMALGAWASSTSLPLVEAMIALSLVAFGLAIMRTRAVPASLSIAAVALFGIFHGHAHGTEASGSILAYSAGFLLSTALLHALGLWATVRVQQTSKHAPAALRIAGALVATTGVVLMTVTRLA